IGRPPYISVKGMMLAVRGLVGFLRQETGAQDVRLVTPKDYAGVLTALEHGAVDFAWLGPTAYVIGSEKIPLIPLAKAKRRTGGSYFGVIVARKDSGISRLEEIKGKTIGFVDPESASGYLYPLKVLLDSGVDPQKDCKAVFLQKHDAVLSAVWSKKIDVGAVIEDSIAGIHDQKILDQLLVLGKTAEIPTDIVACRKDCDPVLREAFKKALLKTGTLKQTSLASSGLPPIMEFLPVNDDDIARVRTFLSELRNALQPRASR
ncbi:MAG TPA: phosphate/phosphite/phosphonate ABC transporter substrate-binding protein, partial [Candidatus Ozemobacteraceae bacterium]